MGKTVAIVQSCYIPWKGYFDLINSVDEFIFYDDMQFTKRDWRNRNKIKTPNGLLWLTIPVISKGKYDQKINETEIRDPSWVLEHLRTIKQFYSKTPYFKQYYPYIENLYKQCERETYLSKINFILISGLNNLLDINTKLSWSTDYQGVGRKTERLVSLCEQAGATAYLSGPAAKEYMFSELFENKNIKLIYFDYSGYSEYSQLFGEFEHGVTILDLLFNCGGESKTYLKSFRSALCPENS